MNIHKLIVAAGSALLLVGSSAAYAQSALDKVIEAAKKEGNELNYIGSPSSWGGPDARPPIMEAFNKKYGLNVKLNFTVGPSMGGMAARIEQEYKAGAPATTDFYFGTTALFPPLIKSGVLVQQDWAALGVNPELEIVKGYAVLSSTSLTGITYNTMLVSPAQAPKTLEDLVDPAKNGPWKGKMAVPFYPDWLAELSIPWGKEKTLDFARKVTSQAAGFIRYSQPERLLSGEYAVLASEADALGIVSHTKKRGGPIDFNVGIKDPALVYYIMMAVPKHSKKPNLATLFAIFTASPEAQKITDSLYSYGHHLDPQTTVAKYIAANNVKVMSPATQIDFYFNKGGEMELQQEIEKMLKR